jgi:hypothetical protein
VNIEPGTEETDDYQVEGDDPTRQSSLPQPIFPGVVDIIRCSFIQFESLRVK